MKQITKQYKNDNKYKIVSFEEHSKFVSLDFDIHYDVKM